MSDVLPKPVLFEKSHLNKTGALKAGALPGAYPATTARRRGRRRSLTLS